MAVPKAVKCDGCGVLAEAMPSPIDLYGVPRMLPPGWRALSRYLDTYGPSHVCSAQCYAQVVAVEDAETAETADATR